MMHCRLMEVQSACCADPSNCPEGDPTPHACPVQCALVFPFFLESCGDALAEQGGDMDEYTKFSRACTRQDTTALVDYAVSLKSQGCSIELGDGRGRRMESRDDGAGGSVESSALVLERQGNDGADDELVAKYAFILTINALGLIEDTTVGAWLEKDRERVTAVLDDAIQLGERYAGRACRRERALAGALAGMTGMGSLKAKGRSAPSRLRRALSDAEEAGLELPALTAIHHELEEGDS